MWCCLRRGTFNGTVFGPNQNKMPYVYTNPTKETTLYKCDKIFCLSLTPIQQKENINMKVLLHFPFAKIQLPHSIPFHFPLKDWILDIQMQDINSGKNAARKRLPSDGGVKKEDLIEQVDLVEKDFNTSYLKIMKLLRSVRRSKRRNSESAGGFRFSAQSRPIAEEGGGGNRMRNVSGSSYDSFNTSSSDSVRGGGGGGEGGDAGGAVTVTSPPGILRKPSVELVGFQEAATTMMVKKKYSFSDPVVTGVAKFEPKSARSKTLRVDGDPKTKTTTTTTTSSADEGEEKDRGSQEEKSDDEEKGQNEAEDAADSPASSSESASSDEEH
jgi:hypothetical protein